LEFFIDNIFVEIGGIDFLANHRIPNRTNWSPHHADLSLYSDEGEYMQTLFKAKIRYTS
jgi:hypothetical protein